jgi:hypothetical protein
MLEAAISAKFIVYKWIHVLVLIVLILHTLYTSNTCIIVIITKRNLEKSYIKEKLTFKNHKYNEGTKVLS